MVRIALVAVVALGCGKSTDKTPSPETAPTETANKTQTAPTETPPTPPALTVETLPTLDLPALDLTAVSAKKAREARDLNKRALALHRAKDYAGAEALYRQTLAVDPGHVLARYNLACVYNMSGRSPEGLAILLQFKKAGCRDCVGRLVRARADAEWESQWKEPVFIALTKDAAADGASRADFAAHTKLVIDAIDSGKTNAIKHLLPARAPVSVSYSATLCEEDCESVTRHRGAASLAKMFRKLKDRSDRDPDGTLRTGFDRLECKDRCCRLVNDHRNASHAYSDLDEICFRVDSGGVVTLAAIHTSGD